jgi:hypothetical protein
MSLTRSLEAYHQDKYIFYDLEDFHAPPKERIIILYRLFEWICYGLPTGY